MVAAAGSFAISERVLKPKATALFILGCVLAYDLTTKTHDVSSLRVYRGPSLLAFTLMMCAYSLRTWRRNGVACDELLFLPGTLHGHEHGVEGPLIEMPPVEPLEESPYPVIHQDSGALSGDEGNGGLPPPLSTPTLKQRQRRTHSDHELDVDSVGSATANSVTSQAATNGALKNEQEKRDDASSRDENWTSHDNDATEDVDLLNQEFVDEEEDAGNSNSQLARCRDLARVVTFFFFRATSTSSQNAAYAPSGPTVFGAALDLSMPVLFNFHLFIIGYHHLKTKNDISETSVKILPIIFLSVLIVRSVIPPGRRSRFWGTLKFTLTAPFHRVRVRDEFIGEALTSWIRPGQDLFFAYSYYFTVIYGTITGKYGLTASGQLLEESWLVHNVILPIFAILPLWVKYLQTLRQAYDSNKRWPHQANSFKYLSATLVIIYGIAHPERRRTVWWLASFFFTLLYQICWDVLMDWNLFEIRRDIQLIDSEQDSCCARISSFRPTSHILVALQIYVVQPILSLYQRIRTSIPNWNQIQLRERRLYKSESFYWRILVFNSIMRFTWMLCFIPAYHVSKGRSVLTSNSDVISYWGVLLPVTEIVRRTFWGFLYLENETIKLMDADSKYSQVAFEEEEDDDASKFQEKSFRAQVLPTWLDNQQQVAHNAATTRAKQREKCMRRLFVFELYGWAAAFVVLGVWAAI